MNKTKKAGLIAVIISTSIFLLEKLSGNFISSFLGKNICGEKYLQEANGVLSDSACGFNSDMYLVLFLILFFVTGLVMLIAGLNKKFFLLSWKKIWILILSGFVSIVLHNLISGLMGIEEAFFFIIVIFIIPIYTLIATLFTLVNFIKKRANI